MCGEASRVWEGNFENHHFTMHRHLWRLFAATLILAALLVPARATLSYTDGDLLLGVRAGGDPGSTQDYVLNLGPASQFTQATQSFVVPGLGSVANDLATFTDTGVVAWSARADVFWGIVGTDFAGDPANTLYATRPRPAVATPSTPWQRRSNSSQSTTNSTLRAFISGYINSTANAASGKGTLQSTSAINSYASFTSGGTDFGFFGGLEGDFSNGTANSVLDLYRLTPTTQNPSGQGLLFVGTFQFNDDAQLTFTPAPPTAPTFHFSASSYTVGENAGSITIHVVRGGLTTGADTVQFDTSDGTALAGTDYTAKTAVAVPFAAGETQADVVVNVANRDGLQPSRDFTVTLSTPSAGTLAAPSAATVTITDSTPQNFGQIGFSAGTYSFAPVNDHAAPNLLEVTLNRANGSDGAVSVDVAIAAGGNLVNGTDYDTVTSPVTVPFAAGELTHTFAIQLKEPADAKLPGTINLTLSNAQGGVTLGTAAATITVTARDKALPSFKLTSKSGKVTAPTFQISGTAKDNVDIARVEVKVSGGTAQLAILGTLTNGSRTLDLSGIALENGKNTLVVTAFDTSGNAAKSTTLKVTYANSRPALAGSYNGLFAPAGAPANNRTGFANLKVTALGAFTGKVTIGAAVLPIKGLFDNAGVAHFNVTGDTALAPVAFALSKKSGLTTTAYGNLALAIATDKVAGTLKDDTATLLSALDADRAAFDGKTPATSVPANYLATKGSFTLRLPAHTSQVGLTAAQFPQGDGAATLKLTAKGVATAKGTLADGTPFTAAAPLSKNLDWPFLAKLYKGQGVISAKVHFDDTQTDSDLAASNVVWIRPPDAAAKYYPGGWSDGILTDVLGAKYDSAGSLYAVPPAASASVLPGLGADDLQNGNADLKFFDGQLSGPVAKTVNITAKNKVANAPADKTFSLKLVATSGLLGGKFKHSDNTSPAFKGILFQKGPDAGGYGFFLSTVPTGGPSGESGGVTLQAK